MYAHGLDRPGYAINPVCLDPTPANSSSSSLLVKVLIQVAAIRDVTRADDRALFEQLETIYALDPLAAALHARQHPPARFGAAAPALAGCRLF